MNKIIFCWVLLFLFVNQHCISQNSFGQHQIDSLKNELRATRNANDSIVILAKISRQYIMTSSQDTLNPGLYYIRLAKAITTRLNDKIAIIKASSDEASFFLDKNDEYARTIYLDVIEKSKAIKDTFLWALSIFRLSVIDKKNDLNKAITELNTSLKLYLQIKNNLGQSDCLSQLSDIYLTKGEYEKSVSCCMDALKLLKNQTQLPAVGRLYTMLGGNYYRLGNYNKALQYYLDAKRNFEANGFKLMLPTVLYDIGISYYAMSKNDSALQFYEQSANIAKQMNDQYQLAYSYEGMGTIYESSGKNEKAIECFEKSLLIKKIYNDIDHLTDTYIRLAKLYSSLNFEKAINILKDQIKISIAQGMKNHLSHAYSIISDIFFKAGDFKNAYEYELKHRAIRDSLFNEKSNKQIAELEIKYETEKKQLTIDNLTKDQKIKELLINQQKQALLKQLIEQQQKQQAIDILNKDNELQALTLKNNEKEIAEQKLLAEKKQKDVLLLQSNKKLLENEVNKKNLVIWGVGLIFILFSVIGYYIYRQSKLKGKNIAIQLEQKLLRSQMNPHFIFNSLFAIQNFMLQNNGPEAAKYLSKFSKLIRMILENSREEYVSLEKEIETLKYYMELQSLRFKNKFDYTIEIGESLENDQTLIPPMLAQPLIENAIEHGFNGKEEKGNIHVKFSSENNYLVCEVDDDGIGREQSKLMNGTKEHKHKSLATSIVKERLERYNQGARNKIKLDIIDKESGSISTGTKAVFYIPLFRA